MLEILSASPLPSPFPPISPASKTTGYLIAGAAAAGLIAEWLTNKDWSAGEYNYWMTTINDTFKQWDQLGWHRPGDGPNACWKKHPVKRNEFLAFWARFSKHYKEHGQVSTYVSDSEEKPARAIMAELAAWGAWLNKTCAAGIDDPPPEPSNGGGTDWGAVFKWGAIGLGAVVVLNIIVGVRGAFPRQ
jgi:hypothetical protein